MHSSVLTLTALLPPRAATNGRKGLSTVVVSPRRKLKLTTASSTLARFGTAFTTVSAKRVRHLGGSAKSQNSCVVGGVGGGYFAVILRMRCRGGVLERAGDPFRFSSDHG